ncbi:MAG: hypothetical protein U0J38_03505 [Bacteroidales bacterium]|nr:hypothetical protein [Bacteroidales bacterium]
MKKVFKIFIYLLFELLVIPILIIYIPYFIYRKKYRAIKLMDHFYNTLIKIEDKLENL